MLDLVALRSAIVAHSVVARVVVVSAAGSVPREAGAAMLVWTSGQLGTIGGGALEWQASAWARDALSRGDRLDKVPLGPELGQCCGGAVLLLTEVWDADRLNRVTGDAFVRPMPGFNGEMPMKVAGRVRLARNGARRLVPELIQGWFLEPLAQPMRPLWIWGAGHVGRALVSVLVPLPGMAITWVDTAADRFPEIPAGVRALPCKELVHAAPLAPPDGEHLILTYSHALDLALCHALLTHGFASLGLIGSATKWARFRTRLAALGHSPAAISRIRCPIGDPSFGKHPQAIAISVACDILARPATDAARQENAR